MTDKEKLEIKIELLEDLKNCFIFNFGSIEFLLSKTELENLYSKYCYEYEHLEEK